MALENLHRLNYIASAARALFWVLLALLLLIQFFDLRGLQKSREKLVKTFEEQRKSRVIAMIHRQEEVSFFGFPVSSYITIEDSEAVLRAIRFTPHEQPIDLILHTPGGLVLAAEQIARALIDHKGKVTVFVPHYAMSGGTLIALAADEIVMDANAVLGPVDPMIGDLPAASIVKLPVHKKPSQISDEMLILVDVARKALVQAASFVAQLLRKHLPEQEAIEVAALLSEGRWTHDFPLTVQMLKRLGLTVTTDVPAQVYELMDLYQQSGGGKPSVIYVPIGRGFDKKGPTPDLPPSAPLQQRRLPSLPW